MLGSDVSLETMGEFLAPLREGETTSIVAYVWMEYGEVPSTPIAVFAFKEPKAFDDYIYRVLQMLDQAMDYRGEATSFASWWSSKRMGVPASNRGSTELAHGTE